MIDNNILVKLSIDELIRYMALKENDKYIYEFNRFIYFLKNKYKS